MIVNEVFKIITSNIFPYEEEQYLYGKIGDMEIAFLFERDTPIIKMRNGLGDRREISIEEFLESYYYENDEDEVEEEKEWDTDAE